MGSEFILTQGMGQKLEFAVRRNGGTAKDIEFLSAGDNFRLIKLLQTGKIRFTTTSTPPPSVPYDIDEMGNIHLTVVSNGFTPEEWNAYLECRGHNISPTFKELMSRAQEKPTIGVTYRVVIYPADKIADRDCNTRHVRFVAEQRGWAKPHWEVACLMRDILTDEQLDRMDLWSILVMHESIKDVTGDPRLVSLGQGDGGRWLRTYSDIPELNFGSESVNFAFVLS